MWRKKTHFASLAWPVGSGFPQSCREEHVLLQTVSDDVLGQKNEEVIVTTPGLDVKATTPQPSYSASFSTPQTRVLSESRSLPVTLECGFLLWPRFPFLWVLPGMPFRILSIIWTGHISLQNLPDSHHPHREQPSCSQTQQFTSAVQGLPPCQGEFFCPTLFSQQTRASCYTPENSWKSATCSRAHADGTKPMAPHNSPQKTWRT